MIKNLLSNLTGKPSVDSIITGLSGLVTQLEAVQSSQEAEVDAHEAAIKLAEVGKAAAKAEMARAAVISKNIRALLGKG